MAVDELDEAAALARGDFDVGDLPKALEEASELILGDVAREATDENSGVVGIRELVHLGGRVIALIREALHAALHSTPHGLLGNAAHHGAALLMVTMSTECLIAAI